MSPSASSATRKFRGQVAAIVGAVRTDAVDRVRGRRRSKQQGTTGKRVGRYVGEILRDFDTPHASTPFVQALHEDYVARKKVGPRSVNLDVALEVSGWHEEQHRPKSFAGNQLLLGSLPTCDQQVRRESATIHGSRRPGRIGGNDLIRPGQPTTRANRVCGKVIQEYTPIDVKHDPLAVKAPRTERDDVKRQLRKGSFRVCWIGNLEDTDRFLGGSRSCLVRTTRCRILRASPGHRGNRKPRWG